MIDRTSLPLLRPASNLNVPHARQFKLDCGKPLYFVNTGNEDVLRVEFIFPVHDGSRSLRMSGAACHQLIDAGTAGKSALDIAEHLDYYGAYLQTDYGADWKSISLFTLARFLPQTLEAIGEILHEAVFPEPEIETWKTRSLQYLQVNREKVSWLSKSAFTETVFGAGHPYGFVANESDYAALSREQLLEAYRTTYSLGDAVLIAAGKVDDGALQTINKFLGTGTLPQSRLSEKVQAPAASSGETLRISKKDAIQSGIRVGKILFGKHHPDYTDMQVVNTLLGGYFGSRLMANIREDKGFTYGIGSGIHPYNNTAVFSIATEVGTSVCDQALEEIRKEISRLATEPVPQAELDLVRNYLIGAFQRSIDNPFSVADRFKSIFLFGLDYNYFDRYLESLKNCTPERVMELSNNHLSPDTMLTVVAG